ncbi:MAG: 8-amino-7-oxononanoate synthase [Planctomycetes bacterium]|nr:8-amino-7-oxononanoate synthase [Planctomycetota bacterium]
MTSWARRFDDRLAGWRDEGLARRLRRAEGRGVHLRVDGRAVVSFASNDYLGLSQHPAVLAAAKAAVDREGAGATASRLICGSRPVHEDLEAALADFKRAEAALVFASGYHAALASIGAILSGIEDAVVMLDRLCHASLLDAARLTGARMRTFKHNDPGDLKRLLAAEAAETKETTSAARPVLIVVESLYSMDGDLAPLGPLYALAQEFGALLLVDEAHATGVLGEGGRGALADVFAGALPPDVVSLGTLSKALGSQGGFVCAARAVTETIVHAGRAFLFSTGLAPGSAAAAREALARIDDGDRRRRLLRRCNEVRTALRMKGLEVGGGPGPILPIPVGEEKEAAAKAERLLASGFWVPAVRYPTVKRGQARLRLSLSAEHTDADVKALLEAL